MIWRALREARLGDPGSTFRRLQYSRHVADIRLIVSIAVLIGIGASAIAGVTFKSATLVGAALGLTGSVIAWAYQSGRTRLGVVDLVSAEIAALCRIMATTDTVKTYIALFGASDAPTDMSRLGVQRDTSTFVFEPMLKDIQQLDGRAIESVTLFYTYVKATRDRVQGLSQIDSTDIKFQDEFRRAIVQIIYIQMLSLQVGRRAITDLMEYEPKQAEYLLIIYLSELTAYDFIHRYFLREMGEVRRDEYLATYSKEIPALCSVVNFSQGSEWNKAKALVPEITRLYASVTSTTEGGK